MQAGGRRGHGAGLARVDRLVALAVGRRVRAADVGRQGHVAVALEGRRRRRGRRGGAGRGAGGTAARRRPSGGLASGPSIRTPRPRRDVDDDPRPQAAAGTDHGVPEVRPEAAHEQDLGLAAARPPAEKAGGEDPAAVRDEEVAGAEELREIGESARCSRAPVARSSTSSREASRAASGSCATSSGGQLEVVRADLVVGAGLGHGLRTASSGGWPRARCRARGGRGARRRGAWRCARAGCGRGSRAAGGTARRCPRSRRAPR